MFGQNGVNSLFVLDVITFLHNPIQNRVKQPCRDHYARDLDWVELGIWSLYGGVDDKFIKSL
ncbi:hypothetical protein [Posidoniimonas polymericola]|nr:hypothetical protein [Posidoniimonas polymericola]